mmetsp:Transcript_18127/g.17273  ORF Transcript_18127/g.17273 Transcript_18127/m.17273 type:complete len:179 (+) Transcript_18127:271-807(+)
MKGQCDQNQLSDYYLKVVADHPLVSFIEDPFASHDVKGYTTLLSKVSEGNSSLRVGIRAMIQDPALQVRESNAGSQLSQMSQAKNQAGFRSLSKLQSVTQFVGPQFPGTESHYQLDEEGNVLNQEDLNREKFTPHLAFIQRNNHTQIADILQVQQLIASYPSDHQVGIIIADNKIESA